MNKEYIINSKYEKTLNVVGGKVNSVRVVEERQNTARVYSDGKVAVAGGLGDLTPEKLEIIAKAKLTPENISQAIPYVENLGGKMEKSIVRAKAVDPSKLLAAGKRLTAKVAKACPNFNVGGKIIYSEKSGSYKNSNGRNLSYDCSAVGVSFVLKDKQSSNIFDAGFDAETVRYGKAFEDKVVRDVTMLHDNFFAEKIKLEDGEYPVILQGWNAVGHIINDFVAEYYLSGGSLLKNKLGERVFNKDLSVYVDRNPSTSHNCAFYDAEGEVAANYRVPLIKDGEIKTLLTTKNTAAMFNLPVSKTTGADYDGVPSLALPGLYIQETAADLAQLTKNQKAIYIMMASGGDITTEGVIGMPVMLAFLVENGKVVGRVSEFNASANVFDMLGKDFIGVSKKDVFESSDVKPVVTKMKIYNA